MITKGVTLTPTCNGVPTPTQVIAGKAEVKVPPATTAVMPTGERLTICLPEPFQGTTPAPSGTTAVKVRVFYDAVGLFPRAAADLAGRVFVDGKAMSILVDEKGFTSELETPMVFAGESATFEAVLALPPGARAMPFVGAGYLTAFEIPIPDANMAPQVPAKLPSVTAEVPRPAILPTIEPGMTLNSRFTGEVAGDVPHTCGGAATGTVLDLPLEALITANEPPRLLKPGDSVRTPAFRITLCPGAPYSPTGSALRQGDVDYRVFTAYRTSFSRVWPSSPVDLFATVTDAAGTPIGSAPAGHVFDPSGVPYIDRTVYSRLSTLVWTFAVAVPKTGGPYFLRGAGALRVLWPIT